MQARLQAELRAARVENATLQRRNAGGEESAAAKLKAAAQQWKARAVTAEGLLHGMRVAVKRTLQEKRKTEAAAVQRIVAIRADPSDRVTSALSLK